MVILQFSIIMKSFEIWFVFWANHQFQRAAREKSSGNYEISKKNAFFFKYSGVSRTVWAPQPRIHDQ